MIQSRIHALLVVFAALLVAGCPSGGGPPKPTDIKGAIVAGEALNPDANGRPSPVVLRIYQLKGDGAFSSSDFFSLYRDDAGVLGDDLLAAEEMTIRPGESRDYEAEFDGNARYVGVVAAFRDIENAQWRGAVELPEDKLFDFLSRKKLAIDVDGVAVNVVFD